MRNKVFRKFITIIFLLIYNIEIFAANLVVDPNSNYNTKLDESASGVPIVNISTPNDRGVSINEFSEYNIDEKGQILNNADNVGRSHLGGLVNANPNLAPNQAANLVIFQVNGSNRSQIEGYLEALSRQKIDVILSNENGIYINNGGTINVKNFTVTTGKVNLKDGDFVGIDVQRGNIVIGPNGIDGTNANYVEIIAKALELRGNIVANDLKVVTGSNSTTSPTNNIAIDAKELGGMYANRIRIISTDKGAGVNSDAFIVSKDSKLEITADGKIKVNKVQGKGIDIKGKEYEQKDLAYSDEEISINADKIKLSGTGTQANKEINLNGVVENNATIYTKEGIKTKGLTNTGVVQAIKNIEIEGNLLNKGEILTNEKFTAKDVNSKKLVALEGISVNNLINTEEVLTNKELKINGSLENNGNIQALDDISIKENVDNKGKIVTEASFTSGDFKNKKVLSAKNNIAVNKLENSGKIVTEKKLDISSSLINSGAIEAESDIKVTENVLNTGEILTNGSFTAKDINSKKLVALKGISVNNLKNDETIATNENLDIVGDFENNGKVSTNKSLNVAGELKNTGDIQTLDNISIKENALNKGNILTNGFFTSKDLKNEKVLSAKNNITVNKLENNGKIVIGKNLDISKSLENSGRIEAVGNILISENANNTGDILTNGSFLAKDTKTTKSLIAKEGISISNLESSGIVATNKELNINGSLENNGNIQAIDKIDILGNVVNTGEILTNGKFTAKDINSKKLIALKGISVNNLKNDEIIATNENLDIAGNFENKGKVSTNKSLNIAGELKNSGDIQTLDNISIKENTLNKGNILTNGFFTSKDLRNEKVLSAKNNIAVNKLENNGKIVTGKNLNISKSLENSGRIEAVGNILISENANNTGDILTNESFLAKDTKTTKSLIAKEGITVNNLESSGIVATNKELNINGNLKNNGNIQAIDKINILGNVLNTGEILTNSSFTSKDIKTTKKLVSKENITVGKLENLGTVITNKKLNVAGELKNSGDIQTLDNISIKENALNKGNILTNGFFTSKDLKNEKILSVKNDITINKLENNGKIVTGKNLDISKSLENSGRIEATGNILISENANNTGDILTNGSFLAKDTKTTKSLIAKEGITVNNLESSGIVATNKELNINGNLKNNGNIQAIDKINILGNVLNTGEILTNSSFTSKDIKTTKKLVSKENITVGKLENLGTVITNKKLNVAGELKNTGDIQTLDNISIKENALNKGNILTNSFFISKDLKNEKVLSSKNDITVNKLENNGKIVTGKDLIVKDNLINSSKIEAIGDIKVVSNVVNTGNILTNGSFVSKDIKNSKNISVNKDIDIGNLNNLKNATVITNKKININGELTNIGAIRSLENIKVTGNTINNGDIFTNKNFVTSDLINNQKIIAKEKIDIKNLKNIGTIASGDKFTINGNFENTDNIETVNLDVTGNKLTNSGSIKADNISTNVSNIINDGKILSFNNISFSNAKNILNKNEITALKDIEANNTNLVNSGEIASNGKVSLNNSSITNTKKIASSTIEMKDNKKFDNTGEIIGNNVTLTTINDIDLIGKLHGAQSLTISGKNITNNGETTGTGLTTITSSNFTNNKNLSAQTLTVTATGDVVNNSMLSGGKVTVKGNNIENNDLISAAGDLTLKAENRVENKTGKAIFAGNKLSITGKEILNNKNSELLGSNIELTADKVRNEVGTIKAFNDITIKTDKFQNIGEVKDLDKYESYYETWDGKILSESEINDWKRYISPHIPSKGGGTQHASEKVRRDQKKAYEEVVNKVENDKYKSLLFPKYTAYIKRHLGNKGEYTETTGSASIQDIPLKEKLRALSETEYGKVLAGNNITIEGKDSGNSQEVLNKDAIISAGNTVKIDTDKLENIVSIGDKKIKVKTGQEKMFIKFKRKKTHHGLSRTVSAEVTYTRDLIDDGRITYVAGSPSIIEGKNVIVNNLVKQEIDDANGEIKSDNLQTELDFEAKKNNTGKSEKIDEIALNSKKSIDNLEQDNINIDNTKELNKYTGINIKNDKINAPKQIKAQNIVSTTYSEIKPSAVNTVKNELVKYSNVGGKGVVYNGNFKDIGEKATLIASTKIIDEIVKSATINLDSSLPSALFIKNVSPDSKYLLETRPKYINQNSFYGSDYFLSRIGYEEKWNRVKRLGDAYYENELIERSITEKLGTRFLNGKEISAKELMDNAASIAKKNGLTIGKPLTKEQITKLDKDIVWYEYQNVDGIQVLAPKIYLSKNTLKNLNTDSRSRITGLENTYVRTGNLENTGLIGGYGNTYVEAKEVNNRTLGNQLAEIRGNNTTIIAQNNINNIGARISGNENLNLVAIDGDIVNKSTVEKIEFNNGEFDRSKFTKIDSVGEIVSNGNLNILTNNYTSIGAITQAKNADINVANDINILSQELNGEQKFGKDDSQYNYYGFERNIGSEIKAENLNTIAKNFNISGSVVTTKTADLNVDKLNIESKVDKEDEIRKSSYKDLLKSGSKKETIHNEENSAGSLYVEGEGLIKGDVNLVGSNLVLGDKSFIGGKLTTDSRELHNSYSLEEKKKGLSGGIGSSGFSIGYGKSESKLKEKDLTNAKSNLVLGDGTTLNKGADITATNLIHGNISINNGDVRFGARKDVKDVETSSKSSGINLSVKIKSDALDRAKQGVDSFKQIKSGDVLGGVATSTNTVTGVVQGLSGNITKKDGSKATLKDIKDGDFKVNNNFYANAGVNLGFNKSSSNSNSHSESGVVTTIRGKDKNSSITYNNVKNIEYIGTQAQDTKFIYNNVENITKKAVELNNYSSSSSKSSGISTGVTINYNNGFQAEADAIRVSASQSKINTNGTTYQNGRFVDVDEVHNNTKNMTLSGFNQIGGTVTGNIQNLTIESKQNTSTTTGSTKGGSIGFAPNGMPNSISANYSQTNGERKYVDDPTTFIIGDGSNLKVGKVENTAGAIGATGNGKLSIDEYIGHNLENKDETKTKGASLSLSPSSTPVSGVGINYANRDLESVTKNTVVGNVSIGKSSGDEINKDIASMTEVTKDEDTKTNIFIESQTIKYALNPSQFKEDLQIAIIEGKATGRTVVKTIDNMINGDKSQDIGDAEKRSLIEIKEAIVRVQTAPAMDIIAEKDLADKNIQARLGVEIEKFDPNDPTLSEKVRERINELKAEGKEIVAFYDKVTKKIFINQNAKDDEVRASIAREYKIKEDLELGRGKENDKGQLRSTVAGEIAYDEIKDRLKKGDKNPISASSFDVAKMGEDSEVTSDKYGEIKEGIGNMTGDAMELSVVASEADINPGILDKDPEKRKKLEQSGKKFEEKYHKNIDYMIEGWHRPEYAERELPILKEKIDKEKNSEMKNLLTARYNYLEEEAHPIRSIKEGFVSGFKEGSADAITLYAASKIPLIGKYVTFGTVVYGGVTSAINASKEEPKIAITFKQANDIKRIAPEFYKDAESSFIIGNKSDVSNSALIGAAEYYYKNNKTPDKRLGNSTGYLTGGAVAYKGISIAESKYNSLKVSTSDINKTVEVAKQNDIGLSQQEGSKHQKGQAPKNQEIVDRLGKGQLDIKKAPGLDTVSEENLIKFQSEVSKSGVKVDLKTGELIGPRGGKGKVVGITPSGKVVANMSGRNVIFENGKQNPVSAGSFKKFEIPKTNEVVEVPSEVIAKNNTKKVSENMFNGFLDKAKSKITGKPVTQVQLERIGIKSEVKDIGLKVDGTTKTGLDIDEALENNLGRTFKTYDSYDKTTKTATSVKSIDMNSKTYISGSGLNNTLNKYERAMKNFDNYKLDNVYLSKDKIDQSILKIVINNEPLNKSQMENLKKFVETANKDGIKVEAVILK
ncbi:endonuclease toxin domain-containing protein [Fusobacterium polymorphum]|uniref:endonuclease toxin domain-containing protein n=1 Tax=Fusobacterium nucleatum subsp. polymorphum TaxID=76857 RepID=UPI0021A8B2F9|nr:hemolysin [Fusobacterium polymorphum]